MAITAIALLALGCGQGGGDGLPIGSPAVINTSIANGAERVSIFAGTNILLTFNTTIDADTAQINDGLGNLTSAIEAVATIGGQPFDKLSGGGSAPFLVTVNNLTAGATNTLSITLGFVNGTAGLLPYDAEIRITVLPEIRTFDAANPNQSSTQNLTGTPMGAQFVFTFTTEHDTLTISEVMAVDPAAGLAIPDFIELHNGTAEAISLANYWIAHGNSTSQATQNETLDPVYFNVITQPNVSDANNTDATAIFDCGGGDNGEFLARFPAGASVSSGESVVIACDRNDFINEFGFEPDFELTNQSGVPDMLALPNVLTTGTLAARNNAGRNSIVETTAPNINDVGGYVVVFFLQNTPGATDGIVADPDALGDTSTQLTELANPNLQDVDLVVYGVRPAATDPAIDKSGDLRIEAGNSASSVTFVTEIGKNQQSVPDVGGTAHAAGLSITRKADSLFEFPNLVNGQPGFSNPLLGGFSEIFGTGNGLSQDGNAGGNNKSATANKARIDPTTGQDLVPDERHDETSERLDLTFTTSLAPTPGQ